MGKVRNGKEAKRRRKENADRREENYASYIPDSAAETLLMNIFAAHETCNECGSDKLVRMDCASPHCMALRDEMSQFYEEVTDDHIKFHNGGILQAGLDY